MLYIIGLGLSDERDITLKGLDAVKSCERIYLEAYTSVLVVAKERLEKLYGKEIVIADREMVESQSDVILEGADKVNVAFLVVGDPFGYFPLALIRPEPRHMLISSCGQNNSIFQ
jgi:diphthine synthase